MSARDLRISPPTANNNLPYEQASTKPGTTPLRTKLTTLTLHRRIPRLSALQPASVE